MICRMFLLSASCGSCEGALVPRVLKKRLLGKIDAVKHALGASFKTFRFQPVLVVTMINVAKQHW